MRSRRTRLANAVALGSLCLAALTGACNLLLSNQVLEATPDAASDAPGDHPGRETGREAASDARTNEAALLDATGDSDATAILFAAACDGGAPDVEGGRLQIQPAFCSQLDAAPEGSTLLCDDFDKDAFADWWGSPNTADGSGMVDLDPRAYVSPGESLLANAPNLGTGTYQISLQTSYKTASSVTLEFDFRIDAWPSLDAGYATVATVGVTLDGGGGNEHIDVKVTPGNIAIVSVDPDLEFGSGTLALYQWAHVSISLSQGESIGAMATATDLCSGTSIIGESLLMRLQGSLKGFMAVGLPYIHAGEGAPSWRVHVDNVTFLTTP
jgi:hypothetical protein